MDSLQERDWKTMRRMKDELLERLAERINRRSLEILESGEGSEISRHRELYKYIDESDGVIAECFDDWRRSTLLYRVLAMRRHGLLTDEDLEQFSDVGQDAVRRSEAIFDTLNRG